VLVERRDRLCRFGVEYVQGALAACGRRLQVVDSGEVEDDLVREMIEVLSLFCARLYGRRSARLRARRALECAAKEPGDA
jgi:putative resolvase